MKWLKLEAETQVPQFMDTAFALHEPLLSELAGRDKPFFFDHWLTQLNLSDAWLGISDDGHRALLTCPKVEDIHFERWQYSTLAIDPGWRGSFALPSPKKNQTFVTTADETVLRLLRANFDVSILQSILVKKNTPESLSGQTEAIATGAPSGNRPGNTPENLFIRPINMDLVADVVNLFKEGYGQHEQLSPEYYETLETELNRTARYGSGWSFVAFQDDQPAAAASYLPFKLPLLGLPSALVGDLVVRPGFRGRGIATWLQQQSYVELGNAGVSTVFGMIDPGNLGSLNQARKAGRTEKLMTVSVSQD